MLVLKPAPWKPSTVMTYTTYPPALSAAICGADATWPASGTVTATLAEVAPGFMTSRFDVVPAAGVLRLYIQSYIQFSQSEVVTKSVPSLPSAGCEALLALIGRVHLAMPFESSAASWVEAV